ncbi:sialidase family protein [Kitasatospora sp. NPDC057198]|uniref:sialidase family protein n=1 Tax=Kitasatospora sp. NPDC057198 TaxID=3346046 RepID=UPI003645AE58
MKKTALALVLAASAVLGAAPSPATPSPAAPSPSAPSQAAPSAAPPSDPPRAELRALVGDVRQATAYRYRATDSQGRSMDAAKVIQTAPGSYLATYHTMRSDGRFHAALASSSDLMNWTFVEDFGPGTSQPSIVQLSDGGYLMAWEQDPANHLALRYFPSRADLFAGTFTRQYDAKRSLSSCAEGTPNIYSVRLAPDIDHSVIELGGHYFSNCDVDRQMRAVLTDFSSWSAVKQNEFDNALLYWGVRGNIGDRDAVQFRGFPYALIEGQYTKNDFGSWRTFLYDYQTGNADPVTVTTHGGSTASANPSVTALTTPSGQPAVLVGLFIPSEGAAPGEAGELLYYRTY